MPPPVAPLAAKPKGALVKKGKGAFRKPIAIDIRLYADYNHKGKVEETDSNYNKRATFPGAILYFACRPSKKELAAFKVHAEENKIVSAKHLSTVTTLKLVHRKGLQKGDEVVLWMDPAEADKVMVFDAEAVNAKAILGKGVATEAKITIAAAKGSSAVLCMTAIVPPTAPKEAVFLNVKVMRAGKEEFKDKCMFGMAPWLMPNTLANVVEAYVVKNGANAGFISTLKGLLSGVGIPLIELHPADAAKTADPNGDHWTQDMFEPGVMTKKNVAFHVYLGSPSVFPARRPGVDGVWAEFLDQGNGMIKAKRNADASMNSFGNLEVTPPLPGFPLGKKYHGFASIGRGHTDMDADTRAFLGGQAYQPVTKIPTDWLTVGHVDEFLCIVPVKGSAKDFRVLYASPGRAQALCSGLKAAGLGGKKICDGRPDFSGTEFEISVDDFLADKNGILTLNKKIETQVWDDIIKAILVKEWGIPETRFIPVPTIFNGTILGSGDLGDCLARTAGMVNCLVLGKDKGLLIMPKPFGPKNAAGEDVFEKDAKSEVAKAANLKVSFIDDWDNYHKLAGEVHCGTNVRRQVPAELFTWWNEDLEVDGKKVNS